MTVRMPTLMMKMLTQMMRMTWLIQPRRDLVVRHSARVLVKQKKLRERSWRTSHMISLLMSMTLKKLNPTKRMTRSTWMTSKETLRTRLLQVWHISRSRINNHRKCLNVIQKKKMVKMTRKFQELIIPPNLPTYKYLKTWKISSNTSSATNPKRSILKRNWNHLSQITYQP